MTLNSTDYHDYDDLIMMELYDSISDEDFSKLNHRLATDPEFVQYYLEFVHLTANLNHPGIGTTLESSNQDNVPTAENILRQVIEEDLYHKAGIKHLEDQVTKDKVKQTAHEQLEAYLKDHPLEIIDNSDYEGSQIYPLIWRNKYTKVITSIAICLLFLCCIWLFQQPVRPIQVAKIMDSTNAKWVETPQVFLNAETYTLTSGMVEISLNSGTNLTLEGPTTLTFNHSNYISCPEGKLVAKVPPQAKGFKVETPSALYTDYGTEFALDVKKNGASEIHVYQGSVGLAPKRHQKTIISEEILLLKDEGKKVSADGLTIETLEPSYKNAKSINSAHRNLYRKKIIEIEPVGYWDFNLYESLCYNQIHITDPPSKYNESISLTKKGPHFLNHTETANGALTISNKCPSEMILNHHTFSTDTADGISIMFWINPLQSFNHYILSTDSSLNQNRHYDYWFYLDDNGYLEFWAGNSNKKQFELISSNQPLPLNQWTFVVLTMNKHGRAILYINGNHIGTQKGYNYPYIVKVSQSNFIVGMHSNIYPCPNIGIRLKEETSLSIIDELAIFDYVVDNNTISSIYRQFKPIQEK